MNKPTNYVADGEVREWLQDLLQEEVVDALTAKIAERDRLLQRIREYLARECLRSDRSTPEANDLYEAIAALYTHDS